MRGFNFLKKSKAEGQGTEWEGLTRMPEPEGLKTSREVSAMSLDVARMQEQAQRLKEMQAAREQALRAFDASRDNLDDAAKRAQKRFGNL